MGPITQLEAALIALVCSSKVSKKQASSLSAQIVPAVLGESSYLPVYFYTKLRAIQALPI